MSGRGVVAAVAVVGVLDGMDVEQHGQEGLARELIIEEEEDVVQLWREIDGKRATKSVSQEEN